MRKKPSAGPSCSLIVRPPYLIAADIDVVAIDLTFGAPERIPAQAPMLCLGGHPAAECLLGVEGSGQTHRATLAVDPFSPSHSLMVERLRELLDPSIEMRVVRRH